MKRLLCVICLLGFVLLSCLAHDANDTQSMEVLRLWKAGEQVTPAAIERYGLDRCFVAEEISDAVFSRMWKKSYKEGCTVPRSSLRYVKVLHFTANGTVKLGEMVCDKAIAEDLLVIFRTLYEARYPIERMVLVDDYGANDEISMAANNTSCFNYRVVSGTRKLSNHSKGRAVDINPLYNPYVKRNRDGSVRVKPVAGKPYADRAKTFKYKISRGDICHKLFKQHGFSWGGDWRSVKDYQHFEKP